MSGHPSGVLNSKLQKFGPLFLTNCLNYIHILLLGSPDLCIGMDISPFYLFDFPCVTTVIVQFFNSLVIKI